MTDLFVRPADESARRFADFTLENLGQTVDLRIDGKSVNKPVVQTPVIGGTVLLIFEEPGEASRLAVRLSDHTAILEVEAVSN